MNEIEEQHPVSPYSEERRVPLKKKHVGRITISTTIGIELHRTCQENGISWAEALRRGASSMLSEKGDPHFQNPRQQEQRMHFYITKVKELTAKIDAFEEKNTTKRDGNATNSI